MNIAQSTHRNRSLVRRSSAERADVRRDRSAHKRPGAGFLPPRLPVARGSRTGYRIYPAAEFLRILEDAPPARDSSAGGRHSSDVECDSSVEERNLSTVASQPASAASTPTRRARAKARRWTIAAGACAVLVTTLLSTTATRVRTATRAAQRLSSADSAHARSHPRSAQRQRVVDRRHGLRPSHVDSFGARTAQRRAAAGRADVPSVSRRAATAPTAEYSEFGFEG
jgi:hypothetical protein